MKIQAVIFLAVIPFAVSAVESSAAQPPAGKTGNWFGDPIYHFIEPLLPPSTTTNHLTHIPVVGRLLNCHGKIGSTKRKGCPKVANSGAARKGNRLSKGVENSENSEDSKE